MKPLTKAEYRARATAKDPTGSNPTIQARLARMDAMTDAEFAEHQRQAIRNTLSRLAAEARSGR